MPRVGGRRASSRSTNATGWIGARWRSSIPTLRSQRGRVGAMVSPRQSGNKFARVVSLKAALRLKKGFVMKAFVRFGRRVPLPSTIQILHELRMFFAEENVRELCAEAEGLPTAASWDAIGAHRAAALVKGNETR